MARSRFCIYPQETNSILMTGFKLFLFQLFFSTACSQTVTLRPLEEVVIAGRTSTFICKSENNNITQIIWCVNGSQLNDQENGIQDNLINGIGYLTFNNTSVEYNDTTFRCNVTFETGMNSSSNAAKIFVQGLLSAVGILTATLIPSDSIISLTWTPPFSLNITNQDPDIKGYNVSVANSTSSEIFSCEFSTELQYNYSYIVSLPNDRVCDTYNFTIFPVNVVGNGASASVTRGILQSKPSLLETEISNQLLSDINLKVKFNIPSVPVCSGSVSLQDIYNSSHMLGPIEVTPDNQDNSISFMIPRSRENLNRFYDATLTLINSAGSTTYNINISTYDVQNIIYNIQNEPVTVTIDYINDTEALGALLALTYFQDENIVCNQSVFVAIRRSEMVFRLPKGVPGSTSDYIGLAYDIENNGVEDKAYPAVRRQIEIDSILSPANDSSCTFTSSKETAEVSCDKTSGVIKRQVILLQRNDSNSVVVVNVDSGAQKNVPVSVVPGARYCVLELLIRDNNELEVRYSDEFVSSASKISTATVTMLVCVIVTLMLDSHQNTILLTVFLLFQLFFTAYCTQDIIDPRERVVTIGGRTTFTCRYTVTTDVIQQFQWLVNEIPLEDLNQGDGMETSVLFDIGHLTFTNIPMEYNDTIIQCMVNFTSGEIITSNIAKLLVQGFLPAVGSLTATPVPLYSIIFLTWTPPFSLDITHVDPDVSYCVGVVNSTSSSVIHSECDITDTQYIYTIPPRSTECDSYTFTITPVNIVGDGVSASGGVVLLSLITEAPQLIENGDLKGVIMMDDSIYLNFDNLAPVCFYSLELYDIHDPTHKYSITENVPSNQVDFRIQILSNNDDGSSNLNRLFSGTVNLINSFGTTMSTININTHDIQDVTYNIQDEPVAITIDYIENAEALGALLALMYLDQDGNVVCNESIYAAIRRSEDDFTLSMGESAITNTYMGLAYDIERNGLEDKAYPAVRRHVDIGYEMPVSSDDVSSCTVTYRNGTVSVSCVDSTSSGYQVVLLQDNDPYNILTVVNVRPGEKQTVPVVPSGRYCIMELPMGDSFDSELRYSREFIAEERDATQSSVAVVAAVASTSAAFVVAAAAAVVVVVVVVVVQIKDEIKKITKVSVNEQECESNEIPMKDLHTTYVPPPPSQAELYDVTDGT